MLRGLHHFVLRKFCPKSVQIAYLRRNGMVIGRRCDIQNPAGLFGLDFDKISIGDDVTVSDSALLIPHDGSLRVLAGAVERVPGRQSFLGLIRIHDNCFIGARAIVLPGVVIGPNAIVGAGAVVTRDVLPNTVVAGNPARVVCTLEELRAKLEAYPQVTKTIRNGDGARGKVVRTYGMPKGSRVDR